MMLQSFKILGTIEPEGLNALEDSEWEELEFAVDSGATETVIGEDALKAVKKIEGAPYKRGEVRGSEWRAHLEFGRTEI